MSYDNSYSLKINKSKREDYVNEREKVFFTSLTAINFKRFLNRRIDFEISFVVKVSENVLIITNRLFRFDIFETKASLKITKFFLLSHRINGQRSIR